MSGLRDAALGYASIGARVVPISGIQRSGGETACDCGKLDCPSAGKHPLIPNWRAAASGDGETIARWWTKWPHANIGLICGEIFDVLDIDGSDALDALAAATHSHALSLLSAELPLVQSGGGAGHLHMYFEPVGANHSSLAGTKIQVLSTGRLVIAPPSMHRSGKPYEQVSGLDRLGPAPDWLLPLLIQAPRSAPDTVVGLEDFTEKDGWQGVRDSGRYAAGALRAATGRVARAMKGTRNNTLNVETFALARFVWSGDLSMGDLVTEMFNAATVAGLDEREIVATIESAVAASHGCRGNS